MIARTLTASVVALVALLIGGVAVTRAQQAPEQARVPGMGRTIPGDRGVIEGQVVEAGSGRPIADAKVDVRGSAGQVYVTTDQSGRYETPALTPGTYSITATAPDHAAAFYDGRAASASGPPTVSSDSVSVAGPRGAQRITMTGNLEIHRALTVDVRPGSRLTDVDIAMPATTALSGRIVDDRGRGLAGAYIQLVTTQASVIGTFSRAAYAQSDSEGHYRVTAVPGDYVVRAYVDKGVRPSRETTQAYIATFFPGVSSQDAAQVIRLGAGVEQYDVDFALLSRRTVRVSGAVVDPAGADLEDVTVSLHAMPAGSGQSPIVLPLNARGEFDTPGVVPGTYTVEVSDPRRPARWKFARDPIEITEDVAGMEIRAVGAASISGSVVRDPRSIGQPDLAQALVSFVNRGAGAGIFNTDADGSFHGDVPAGSFSLLLMGPRDWAPRAIRLDGVDVFGVPLELTAGAHEIEIVVTDRLGSASGLVVDRRGATLGGFDVVLFPADEARWHFASPLIRQTRSSQNGSFELPMLPPGDYLAVATENVPVLMLGDPAPTLRRLQSIATRLTIGDGEQKTVSIRASAAP